MKSKKGATGVSIILNLIRFIPVIIIILFISNVLYSDLGNVINDYDQIMYHQMSRRILYNKNTNLRNGLIDLNKITPVSLSNIFHENLVICYYFDSPNQEMICNRDIDYEYESQVLNLRKIDSINNKFHFLAPVYYEGEYFISNISFYILGDYSDFN